MITNTPKYKLAGTSFTDTLADWIPQNISEETRQVIQNHIVFLDIGGDEGELLNYQPYKYYPHPFDPYNYHATKSIVYCKKKNEQHIEQLVETWFLELPILNDEKVYLMKRPGDMKHSCWCGVTTWGEFCTILWRYVVGGFETLTILDDTKQWMVLFGPEDAFIFVEAGGVDSSFLSKKDNAYGFDLKRIRSTPTRPAWPLDVFTRKNMNQYPCECQGPCSENCPCLGSISYRNQEMLYLPED